MKTTTFFALSFAVVLLGSPLRAQNNPTPANPASGAPAAKGGAGENSAYKETDKALDEIAAKSAAIKKCQATYASLQTDYAKKKKEIAAANGGAVPEAYSGLLGLKQSRISRQHAVCKGMNDSLVPMFNDAITMVRSLEPRASPATAKRRERLNSLRALTNPAKKTEEE